MMAKKKKLPKALEKAQRKTMTFNLSLNVKVDCGRLDSPISLWTSEDPLPGVVLPTPKDVASMVKEALREYAKVNQDCFFGSDPDCKSGYEGGAWIANSKPRISVSCN